MNQANMRKSQYLVSIVPSLHIKRQSLFLLILARRSSRIYYKQGKSSHQQFKTVNCQRVGI